MLVAAVLAPERAEDAQLQQVGRAPETLETALPAEKLERLEERRRDGRATHGDPDRLEQRLGLHADLLGERPKGRLDGLRRERTNRGERVGGNAQTKAMRQVAGRLRLDMAAYRELAAFALMASDLDKATQQQLGRGQRMQEILKQPQYEPVDLENQVMVIFAGTQGFADEVPVEKMRQWEVDLIKYMAASHPDIGKDIAEKKQIAADNEKKLRDALAAFKATWQA